MPRRPKQQTLIVAPGTNPATQAGTPEAKAAMAKARAARGQKAKEVEVKQTATPIDRARSNPTPGALMNAQYWAVEDLGRLADALMSGRLTGQLSKAQVTVLLMKGFELGLGAVEAVQALYLTPEGRVELSAELMRALILRQGVGYIIPAEVDDTHVVVQAYRYGVGDRDDYMIEFSYSIQDAQRAGLLEGQGSGSWRMYPRQMCFARATTEAGRALFADVLLAAGYGYGELQPREGVVASTPEIPVPEPTPEPASPESTPVPKPEPDVPPVLPPEPEPAPAPTPEPQPEVKAEAEPTPPAGETAKRYKAGTVAVAPPATQPEPAPAPQAAAPAPTPAPPPTPAPQGTPAGWPEGRAVLHSFPTQGPRGEVKIIQTGGVRKEQITRLLDITTGRAGQVNWQGLQDIARRQLQKLGLTLLPHLTQEEATLLIQALEQDPLYTQVNGPTEVRHEQLLDAMLAEVGGMDLKPKVLQIMARTYGTDNVNAMPPESFRKALVEMRSLAADPATFGLMLEQIVGQAG